LKNSELEIFNFSVSQKAKLMIEEQEGKYRFMIYDQSFVDFYAELRKTSLFLRHLLWLLASIGIYFLSYFFIYLF